MKTENRFYIRILSLVHIGCDEVYEPMGFIVDENSCTLTAFDPLDFFRSLSPGDKTRFADICRKGTIASLLELNLIRVNSPQLAAKGLFLIGALIPRSLLRGSSLNSCKEGDFMGTP